MPRAALVLLLLLSVTAPARAAIYKYVDKDGVIHFTNAPPAAGARPFNPDAGDEGFGGQQRPPRFANTPRMWQPVPVASRHQRYDGLIASAALRYKLPPALVKAVVATESGFHPRAESHAGACGLMQLMPATAREMNVVDIFDPEQNVFGGARYLRYLINTFDGNVTLAVAAYNAGPVLVNRVKRVPDIPETRRYVKTVLALYRKYRRADLVAQGG